MAKKNEYEYNVITDTGVLDSYDKKDKNSVIYASAIHDEEIYQEKDNQKNEENLNHNFGLFVTDISGNKPDSFGKDFFKLFNKLCGNIFECSSKSGEITLKQNKSSITLISNKNVSKSLAELIEDNIEANAKQRILFRVGRELGNVDFDSYKFGFVDIFDLKYKNTDDYCNTLQACMIYHFTYERVNTENYEDVKQNKPKSEFDILHNEARNQEVKVWNEMRNDNISNVTELNWSSNHPVTNTVSSKYQYKSIYYGDHFKLVIIIDNYSGKLLFEYEIL